MTAHAISAADGGPAGAATGIATGEHGLQRRGSRLYRDAASLASSSGLTALVGIGFWAMGSRLLDADDLGVQAALLALITAPGLVVASGIGDAFTALIPPAGDRRAAVVRRGYRILLGLSVVLGLLAAALSLTVLPQVRGNVLVAAMVFAGVVIWSFYVVQDAALTSLQRAHWLPIENGSVSVVKVLLVPAAIALGLGQALIVATVLPAAVAVLVLYPRVRRLAADPSPRRRDAGDAGDGRAAGTIVEAADRHLPKLAIRTTTSIGLSLGTLTLTPFIVTAAAGPTQGAVFSVCLAIVQGMDLISTALGVSLVVHGSARADEVAALAVGVLRRMVLIVGGAGALLICASPLVLRVLNPDYLTVRGELTITLLAVGSLARVVYVAWSSLQRARRTMKRLLILNAIAAAFVFATLPGACIALGSVGGAAVVCAAQLLLSAGAAADLIHSRLAQRRPAAAQS